MQTNVTEIVEDGIAYLRVICLVSAGAFFGQNFEKLLVATGHSVCAMVAQASGAVFNIIFDPLLIFGIGPFPELGVTGAAAATVLGQIVAALVAMVLALTKQRSVGFHFRAMVPDGRSLKEIYSVGIPSIITVGLSSAMSFFLNQIFLAFSTTATAVFGIWLKLQNFAYMPVFGLNNGTIPMISYNYGAGKMDRVDRTIHMALGVALVLMCLLLVVFELFPAALLGMFSATENMRAIGTVALRCACVSLPFGATAVILSSSFQSLGRSRYTLVVNLCRQLIFMVPIAWALSLSGRLEVVWLAIPLAEALSALVAVGFRRKLRKEL
jgi:putative MATE family efflux protein